MLKIRRGDAAIYDPNLNLFENEADPQPKPAVHTRPGKPRKAMLLKDVVAQQVSNRIAYCLPGICYRWYCSTTNCKLVHLPRLAGYGDSHSW